VFGSWHLRASCACAVPPALGLGLPVLLWAEALGDLRGMHAVGVLRPTQSAATEDTTMPTQVWHRIRASAIRAHNPSSAHECDDVVAFFI
jgi:hypothetical protein